MISELHRWCFGYRACLKCCRSLVRDWLGQTKDYKIGICFVLVTSYSSVSILFFRKCCRFMFISGHCVRGDFYLGYENSCIILAKGERVLQIKSDWDVPY